MKVIFIAGPAKSVPRKRAFTQSLGTQTVAARTLTGGPVAPPASVARAGVLLAGSDAAIALPPGLAARAFAPAWAIAIALHFALLGVAMIGPTAPPPEPPAIRLVFVEPPPPPPAPLGAANGAGTIAAVPEPEPIAKAPEPVREPVKPVQRGDDRLVRPDARAKSKPKPQPRPQAKPADEPERRLAAADVAPGVAAGSADGQAGGVVGGVEGGVAGGVVGGTGSGPVPAGQVANPPTLVRRVAPVYPEEARRRGVEGLVLLEAILDRNGTLEPGIKVVRSIPLLDPEAIAAVRQWRFRPVRDKSGQALRVILEIPIRFVLR